MKDKTKLMLVIGLIAFVIGLFLYLRVDGDAVNQKNIEIATTATNAEDAARQIAANNRAEVGGNGIALFLMGLGGAMTVLSGIKLVQKNKTTF